MPKEKRTEPIDKFCPFLDNGDVCEKEVSATNHLHLYRGFGSFVKKNVVMVIAMIAALVTCFLVPPDKAYLDYFDVKTLTCLFCVLAVVCALKNINFFYILA